MSVAVSSKQDEKKGEATFGGVEKLAEGVEMCRRMEMLGERGLWVVRKRMERPFRVWQRSAWRRCLPDTNQPQRKNHLDSVTSPSSREIHPLHRSSDPRLRYHAPAPSAANREESGRRKVIEDCQRGTLHLNLPTQPTGVVLEM
jgi:hypothetical protein